MTHVIWPILTVLALIAAYFALRQYLREEPCPECGARDFDKEGICTSCGYNPEHDRIEYGRDGKSTAEAEESNCTEREGPQQQSGTVSGASPSRREDYTTEIDPKWKHASGTSVQRRNDLNRQRKKHNTGSYGVQKESKKKTERKKAIRTLLLLTSNLALPKQARDRAKRILREAHENDIIKGRTFDMFIVGSVYAAIREYKVPRSLTEILEKAPPAVKTTRRDVKNALHLLDKNLALHICIDSSRSRAMAFTPRLAEKLQCPVGVAKTARRIIKNAGTKIQSLRPAAIAAGAIYHASQQTGRGITKAAVKRASTETEQPVRTAIKKLP